VSTILVEAGSNYCVSVWINWWNQIRSKPTVSFQKAVSALLEKCTYSFLDRNRRNAWAQVKLCILIKTICLANCFDLDQYLILGIDGFLISQSHLLQTLSVIIYCGNIKPPLMRPLNEKAWLLIQTDGSLSKIKRNAESSYGSFPHYFRPALSVHLSLRLSIRAILSGRIRGILLYNCSPWLA